MGDKIGVKEAADRLGVSKRTVYNRLRDGMLPGDKVPSKTGSEKWIIDTEDLEEYATMENEVVDVKEIDKKISKQELMEGFSEVLKGHSEVAATEAMNTIDNKIEQQNERFEQLEKQNTELKHEIHKLRQEIKNDKEKSILDKIKNLFK